MRSVSRFKLVTVVLGIAILCAAPADVRAEIIRTGGTGALYETLKRLGDAYVATERGAEFEVVPSLGSGGSIKAVSDGVIDFAFSGRPLKAEEKAKGLTEVSVLRTPYVLVTSLREPQTLKSAEVADFYANEKSVWKNGAPVRVVLRPKSDSDTAHLGETFPGMHAAIEKVRSRSDVPVAATDQDNADTAERIAGSLVGATYTQVLTEQRKLKLVAIDGVEPTMETFETGSYPYAKTFTFVFPAQKSPAVERFIAFLHSPAGDKIVRETGNVALKP